MKVAGKFDSFTAAALQLVLVLNKRTAVCVFIYLL